MKKLLVILCFTHLCYSQPAILLPASFKTLKGVEIKNAKVTGQTPDAVKVMHDGGIATLPHNQLPPEVLTLLGVDPASTPPEDSVVLPDPLETAKNKYEKPELVSVEPDGIRIKHMLGSAKVPYEDLPPAVVALVGPFDAALATSFRAAQAERDRAAYTATRKAILDAQQSSAVANPNNSQTDAHRTALLADPKLVSPSVFVELIGQSFGGKSRDTSWTTTWGSYNRDDASSRKMLCTIRSKSSGFQRARIQCLFLTREVSGGKDLLYEIVADDLVSLGPGVTKNVGASGQAEQSDDNYAALGLRVREGVKYVGWSWRAIDGQGRVSAVYSSIPPYDRYGWSTPVEPAK